MSGKRAPLRLGGLTMVEVLVGIALLAVLGAALSALQIGTLRANRNAQSRLQAAALLADEVVLQRVLGGLESSGASASACANPQTPDGWSCSVTAHCLPLPTLPPCAARLFTVEIGPPTGAALRAMGARLHLTGGL